MRLRVVAVGRPRLAYARLGVEEYARRMRRYAPLDLVFVRKGEELLPKAEGHRKVVLDERGRLLTTEELYRRLLAWEGSGWPSSWAGPRGTRRRCGRRPTSSFPSPLTLQHELALLVLMEQLYRVLTLRAGHPYHRP